MMNADRSGASRSSRRQKSDRNYVRSQQLGDHGPISRPKGAPLGQHPAARVVGHQQSPMNCHTIESPFSVVRQ